MGINTKKGVVVGGGTASRRHGCVGLPASGQGRAPRPHHWWQHARPITTRRRRRRVDDIVGRVAGLASGDLHAQSGGLGHPIGGDGVAMG